MIRWIFLCAAFFIFFCVNFKIESLQYNVDYLIDLIEEKNEEGIRQFFSQPIPVTKIKHIVEFTEVFRSKLEERFGYKPSYREAYDYFKANISQMNFPKEQAKKLLSIFKEITKQFEQAEKKGYYLNSETMNYKGPLDSDNNIPNELVIAYHEALVRSLICIIPSPGFITQGIGAGMIIDSARRTYDYLEKRNSQRSQNYHSDNYSDPKAAGQKEDYKRSHDHDSWDKEYK